MTISDELYIENYTDEMLFELIEDQELINNKINDNIEKKPTPINLDTQESSDNYQKDMNNNLKDINKIKMNNDLNFNTRKPKVPRPWSKEANAHLRIKQNILPDQHNIKLHHSTKLQESQCGTCKENSIIKVIDGKIICIECGRVISIKLDNKMENRTFKDDGNFTSNTGYTLVSTSMFPGYVNTNVVGNNSSNLINKLNMWNNSLNSDEKNIMNAYRQIREVCQKAGFSKRIEDNAKSLYLNLKKCANEQHIISENNKKKINREDKQSVMVAICIQKSCNVNDNAYNKAEIAQLCNVNIKEMTKGEKLYCEVVRENNLDIEQGQTCAHKLVPRLCKKLIIPNDYQDIAVRICKNIEKLYICSNSTPQSLAATAVNILVTGYEHKLPIPVTNIAKNAYMAESTIEKCYKKMTPYLGIIINDTKTDNLVKDINEIIETLPIPAKFDAIYKNIMKT